MKMYMPLVASEDGVVQLIKQPGVSLEPGDILGILTLDDPARVKHAKPFEGQLPATGPPGVIGNKPYQRFLRCIGILNDILDGFDNQAIMASTLKDLIDVYRALARAAPSYGAIVGYNKKTSAPKSEKRKVDQVANEAYQAVIQAAEKVLSTPLWVCRRWKGAS